MTRIGLISDTHGFLDESVFQHFANVDEIWHAGDVGDMKIIHDLQTFKPLRAVFGNIDSKEIQWNLPENLFFDLDGFKVWITHIGGSPPNYNPAVKNQFKTNTPDIFVCGHSHILRVMKDPARNKMLYLNSGAAGHHGFHHVRTLLRFVLDNKQIKNMEVVELGKRGSIQ